MPLSVGELLAYLKLDSTGFDAGIAKAREGMAGATGSAEKLGGAVGMTERALANAGRSAGIASSGTAKFRAAQLSAVAAAERYNAVLADETATVGQLARAEAALIRANQAVKASTPVASIAATGTAAAAAATKMTGLRASMGSALGTAKSLGLMFGAFELVKKGIDIGKQAGSFQRSMLLIQTQAHGTAAEVKDLSARVLDLAGPTATAPEDLATSLYHVYSVGRDANGVLLKGARAMEIVKIAAEGAKVGMADVEDTTNALTSTVASGIGGVKNFGQAMGVLNAIVGAGDMHFSDLNAALGTGILARMRVFGLSIQEVGAMLAVFGDNNIRGADAATALRMSVQDLAKPAAGADAVLSRINLTGAQLQKSLGEQGFTATLRMLSARMTEAGITGNKVGAFLQDAFTKKAGAGLAIAITQIDRYNAKLDETTGKGNSFGAEWQATSASASVAWQRIGVEAEVAGIKIANKVIPAATAAATWLGTNLPHAVSVLAQILGPTVSLIGDGLGHAWAIVSGALHGAISALGSVGHFLEQNKTAVTAVTTAVVAMWAASKLIAGAVAIYKSVAAAIGTLRVQAALGRMEMESMSVGALALKGGLVALGVGVGVLTYMWQRNQQQAAEAKAAVDSFSQALDEDSQAIGRNVRAQAAKYIIDAGLNKLAHQYGVSQKLLTDAAVAQGHAQQALTGKVLATAQAHGAAGSVLFIFMHALAQLQQKLGGAIQNNKDLAAATKGSTAATVESSNAVEHHAKLVYKDNAAQRSQVAAAAALYGLTGRAGVAAYRAATKAARDSTSQTKAQTLAFQAENDAASLLQQALDGLAGVNLAVASARTASAASLRELTKAFHDNGSAITDTTKKGIANQQAIQQQVQTDQALAAAIGKKTKSGQAEIQSLKDSRSAAIAAAKAQGVLTPALQTYIDKLYNVKGVSDYLNAHPTKLDVNTAQAMAALDSLATKITGLVNGYPQVTVTVVEHGGIAHGNAGAVVPGKASGGGLPEGVSAVGERGAELAIKNGRDVQILSHGQSRAYLAATGMKAPGFAGGTNPITTAQSGGKEVWVYKGTNYPSRAKAQAALDKAVSAPAQSALGGIQISILAPTPTALRQFLSAADAAARKITTAAAAGVSPKKLAELRANLADLVKTANRQLSNLRVKINHADMASLTKSLSGSASDVRGAWQSIVTDLRSAGLGSGAISALSATERSLASHVGARDRIQAALTAARQARAEERSTVFGAVSGFFNVTAAGANPVSGQVSFGSYRAQQLQAKNQILKWAAGIRKLQKMFGKSKVGIEYLRSLAEAGPSTLPQVEALLSGGAAGLQSVIDTQRTINKTAASIGGLVGRAVDQPGIDTLKTALDKQNKAIDKLGGEIKQGLRDGLDGLAIEIDPRGLARLVDTGHKKNARR